LCVERKPDSVRHVIGTKSKSVPQVLDGRLIIDELIRNMELGQFELAYSVLLPRIFTVYLHPDDHERLKGVFDLIAEDAKRALCAHVARLNAAPKFLGIKRPQKARKEHRIAGEDWIIDFLSDPEGSVPAGDIEIHSELNETVHPGYQGAKTTLLNREPSVTAVRTSTPREDTRKQSERVYAEIRYEDDSGPQLYLMTQNRVRVGRGGDYEPMELALYANDQVSREHFILRRDAATNKFSIEDKSTNGTWVDGKRLKSGLEQVLAERAEINVGEVLTLLFQVRK
jgi:FHA domain